MRKEILNIKPYIPGKPIEEVKRELGLKEAIKLASNENALPPPKKAVAAGEKALLSLNRYPDGGSFYLKKALARRLKVKPENIVVGNGSDEVIVLVARAFIEKGDEVIIAEPTFLIYEIAAQIERARIRYAPLKNLRYDVEKIAGLVSDRTKLIFIANPDNPTGTYITQDEVRFLVSRTPAGAILFFDEAYFEFAKSLRDFPDTMKYLKRGNVIIARSFSKTYSLAGARVGYGISTESIIDCLNRVREPFNVNSVGQAMALAALADKSHIAKTMKLVREGKEYLYRELDLLGMKYVPSATNFVLINARADSKTLYKKLLRRGIIVREMSPWKLKNFIRVTIGTMAENRKFLRALREVLT